jgi:cellulose synthase/poly-beta-1,6-N-acetylglucosamine synthase-like glycosyltransferase
VGDISEAADEAVWALARAFPEYSAHIRITRGQQFAAGVLGLSILLGFVFAPRSFALAIAAAMAVGFVANVLFRSLLIWIGAEDRPETADLRWSADEDLPIYTILVPVYREAKVLSSLIANMRALDYPRSKLDIRIVAESDDAETVIEAQRLATGEEFTVVQVPVCHPRTKPKACNFALPAARGEYLVIYDAEDRPEPDQLRKAVAAFHGRQDTLACLQARLSFYNASDSWLSAMFTLDYELWFGFLLPGLSRLGVPMPLGGTSNHFRTGVLREIRGWDPFNVTEDADLGVRLAKRGYRVATLDSTTFEEATNTLGNWTRQRSRWMKGYMQTWLVHMRDPVAFVRSSGLRGFLAFQIFIGGAVLAALVNPMLWSVFLLTQILPFVSGWADLGSPLASIALASLIGGNAIFTYVMMLGAVKRDWFHLTPYGLSSFVYWLFISAAAYRGLWQLYRRPFYWEKTAHGLSRLAIGT